MKLKDARENSQYFAGKLSDIVRQLGLAGIAVIWTFRVQRGGQGFVGEEFELPAFGIVVALGLDFLNYAVATALWAGFHWYKELWRKVGESTDFKAPRWINWPATACFWGKAVAMLLSWLFLLAALSKQVTYSPPPRPQSPPVLLDAPR